MGRQQLWGRDATDTFAPLERAKHYSCVLPSRQVLLVLAVVVVMLCGFTPGALGGPPAAQSAGA